MPIPLNSNSKIGTDVSVGENNTLFEEHTNINKFLFFIITRLTYKKYF